MKTLLHGLVTPIIKVVGGSCNLKCDYCYYKPSHHNGLRMSSVTLANLIKQTIDYSEKEAHFIWHGGEPLLAGIDFYREAFRLQKGLCGNKRLNNSMQTNAVMLNQEWGEFISTSGFGVGVSIDGPQDVHNENRRYGNGKGSFYEVTRGIKLLQSFGVRVGGIAMVTSKSLGREREILDFFFSIGLQNLNLKPCYEVFDGKLTQQSVSPNQYVDFMINMLDAWLDRDDESLSIQGLEEIIRGLLGKKVGLCEFSGKCSMFPTVDYDGEVRACDCISRKYKLGNINVNTWEEIFSSSGLETFLSDHSKATETCNGCEWFKLCNGGCIKYQLLDNGAQLERNPFCAARKRLFRAVKERVLV